MCTIAMVNVSMLIVNLLMLEMGVEPDTTLIAPLLNSSTQLPSQPYIHLMRNKILQRMLQIIAFFYVDLFNTDFQLIENIVKQIWKLALFYFYFISLHDSSSSFSCNSYTWSLTIPLVFSCSYDQHDSFGKGLCCLGVATMFYNADMQSPILSI